MSSTVSVTGSHWWVVDEEADNVLARIEHAVKNGDPTITVTHRHQATRKKIELLPLTLFVQHISSVRRDS